MKKQSRLWLGLFLFCPLFLSAASFGPITLHSYLNEPLRATIPLINLHEPIKKINVNIADKNTYAANHINYSPLLKQLHLQLRQFPATGMVIEITSHIPINVPSLEMLIVLKTPHEQIRQSFSLLLDPRTRPQAKRYGPTQGNDELWRIAHKYRSGNASIDQTMIAIYEANPDAFAENNINQLKAGYMLVIPASEAVQGITPTAATKMVAVHNNAWHYAGHLADPPAAAVASNPQPRVAPVVAQPVRVPMPARPPQKGLMIGKLPFNIVKPIDENKYVATPAPANTAPTAAPAVNAELAVTADALQLAQQKIQQLDKQILGLQKENTTLKASIVSKDQMLLDLQTQLNQTLPHNAVAMVKPATAVTHPPKAPTAKIPDKNTVSLLYWLMLILAGSIPVIAIGAWLRFRYVPNRKGKTPVNSDSLSATLPSSPLVSSTDNLASIESLFSQKKYAAAEQRLKSCLQEYPLETAYALRLLQYYVETHNPQGFLECESQLSARLLQQDDFIAALNTLRANFERPAVVASTPAVTSVETILQQAVVTQVAPLVIESAPVAKPVEAEPAPAEVARVMDFHLTADDLHFKNIATDVAPPATLWNENTTSMEKPIDGNDMQEQLDVAIAYFEIADFEGAEVLLQQVAQQGTALQKQQAQQYLAKMQDKPTNP